MKLFTGFSIFMLRVINNLSYYKKSNMLLVAASQIIPGICLSTSNITLLQNINYIAES